MTRFHLLLALAGVTGAAVALAPTSPASATQTLTATVVTPAAAPAAATQPNVGWLARYGVYNAHQGSWSFIPAANAADGC